MFSVTSRLPSGRMRSTDEARQRMPVVVQAVVREIGDHRLHRAPGVRCVAEEARDLAHLADIDQAVGASCDGVRKFQFREHGFNPRWLTGCDRQPPDCTAVPGPAAQVADQPGACVHLQEGARQLDAARGIGLCRSGDEARAVTFGHPDGQARKAVAGSFRRGVQNRRLRSAQFQRVGGRIGRGLVRQHINAGCVDALKAGEVAEGIALGRLPAALGRAQGLG